MKKVFKVLGSIGAVALLASCAGAPKINAEKALEVATEISTNGLDKIAEVDISTLKGNLSSFMSVSEDGYSFEYGFDITYELDFNESYAHYTFKEDMVQDMDVNDDNVDLDEHQELEFYIYVDGDFVIEAEVNSLKYYQKYYHAGNIADTLSTISVYTDIVNRALPSYSEVDNGVVIMDRILTKDADRLEKDPLPTNKELTKKEYAKYTSSGAGNLRIETHQNYYIPEDTEVGLPSVDGMFDNSVTFDNYLCLAYDEVFKEFGIGTDSITINTKHHEGKINTKIKMAKPDLSKLTETVE